MRAIAQRLLHPARVALRSLAQVFLQGSALTGVFVFAGLAIGLPSTLPAALLGLASGIAIARLLRVNGDDIAQGLYGYNGALVGLALQITFESDWRLFALIALGGCLTSVTLLPFRRGAIRIPALTAPFVLVGWSMLTAADAMHLTRVVVSGESLATDPFSSLMRGIGQVMFQDQPLAGLLFLVGITACSRWAGAWVVLGSALGLAVAGVARYPESLADNGLYGYNAVLAAIALSRQRARLLAPLAGIVLSVVLMRGFQLTGAVALTAPFVLATWLTGAVESMIARRCRTSA